MLDGGRDALGLNALDECACHVSREQRVFGIRLEAAAAKR